MRTNYPAINAMPTISQVGKFLQYIQRARQVEDLPDWDNLNQVFVSGRSSRRVPSSATDVVAGDKLGDIVYATDGTFMYTLVSASGTNVWGRVALTLSW